MKRFFIGGLMALSLVINAQDKKKGIDPKYAFCYKQATLETDDYKIYIDDAVNENMYSKFKVRVFNKTNDYLIFKPADVIFKIGSQELTGKDKQFIILPNEEGGKVIDVKGTGLQEEKYTVEIKNVYKVSANSPAVKCEDFKLPVANEDFTAGNFKCNLKKSDLRTDKSVLKFECAYNGDAIGILAPGKCVAIMPKGQENANVNRNKGTLLEKGKSDDFNVELKELKGAGDMQKVPFKLVWGETFKESKIEPIKGGKVNMELDQAKTTEKNQ
ncbi:MAG TPA: hypothetical protein VN026_05395 [Bacteroidia bacterium]|nr:hypothetical protein [Bacteroidia bacterium]